MSSRMPSVVFRPESVYPKIEGSVLCQSVIFPGQQHHCVLLPHCIQGLCPNFSSELLDHCFDGWAPWEKLLQGCCLCWGPSMDQNSAWHLGLAFLMVLAPALGAKQGGGLTLSCTNPWGRSGMGSRGAAAFALPSLALCGCAALPDHPQGRLWDGSREGQSRIHVFGNIPCPAEPQLPFPPRCGATGAWEHLHDPAVINAVGRAAPACSAIPPVQSRGIIHISDKRIGY